MTPLPAFRAEDLAVVVPTFNRWDALRRCLDALRNQTVSGFEVVVVVDGDDAPVPTDIDATVVVRPHAGPAAARNAGVASTDRRLILFLGDDVFVTPQAVERHLGRHNAEPSDEVAVLGRVDWHPDVADAPINRWLDWSGSQFDFHAVERATSRDLGFGRFFTSNVSLKRALFDDAGGFDEEFPYAAYEDIELGWRLAEKGMVLRYEPGARAHHLHHYDWPSLERRFQAVGRSERIMVRKHPWFEPFFREQVAWLRDAPPISPIWARGVERIPPRFARARAAFRERADRWYCQRLAGPFLDAYDGERGLEELREYLGEGYDEAKLRNHSAEVDAEEHAAGSELDFYRSSEAYLYDLTVFAMSGTKAPYRRVIRALAPPGAKVLDYGCGIGSDGLLLAEDGYDVAFADFDNPSTRFLRWRLDRRGIDSPIYDVDANVPAGFDLVFCFDVIEHVRDPFDFLAQLEGRGGIVVVNFLEPEPGDTHLHKPLPIDRLLRHAAAHDLLHYSRHHGRSHLVAYRPVTPERQRSARRAEVALAAQRLRDRYARA